MNLHEHEQDDRHVEDAADFEDGISVIRKPEHFGPGEYIAAATLCNMSGNCIALASDA